MEWKREERRESGQSKVLQRTRSRRRRFMDSARSHLKDYIEQTITNRPFFSRWDWFNSLPYPLWYRFSRHPRRISIPSICRRPRGESSNCSLMTMRRQVAAVQLYFMGISWYRYWLRFLILKCRWRRGVSGKREISLLSPGYFEGLKSLDSTGNPFLMENANWFL